MPIEDHVLLLQLERQYEAIEDKVDSVADADQYADAYHEHDDWYASDSRMSEAENDLSKAEQQLDDHTSRLDDLADRVITLEAHDARDREHLQGVPQHLADVEKRHTDRLLYLEGYTQAMHEHVGSPDDSVDSLTERVASLEAELHNLIKALRGGAGRNV